MTIILLWKAWQCPFQLKRFLLKHVVFQQNMLNYVKDFKSKILPWSTHHWLINLKLMHWFSCRQANKTIVFQELSRLMKKPTKWPVHPAKTQISLDIHPIWSESLLSAWRKLRSLATHWVHSEDSDQTGRMPRLIWVFAGRTVILLVLSWGGSIFKKCLSAC